MMEAFLLVSALCVARVSSLFLLIPVDFPLIPLIFLVPPGHKFTHADYIFLGELFFEMFAVTVRKWPRSLFLPVQAWSCKERSGAGWDQDGPGWPPPRDLDGSETL